MPRKTDFYIDAFLAIGLGLTLLARSRRGSRGELDEPDDKFRRRRLRRHALGLIAIGTVATIVLYLIPRPGVGVPPESAWLPVTSTDRVLSFSMPGDPKVETVERDTELGRIRRVKHTVGIEDDSVIFSLEEIHYLDDRVEFDTKEYTDGMVEATLSKIHAEAFRRRDVASGVHVWKEVGVKFPKGYVIWMRFLMINKTFYQVRLTIPEADFESPIVERYFDGFEIGRPPAG